MMINTNDVVSREAVENAKDEIIRTLNYINSSGCLDYADYCELFTTIEREFDALKSVPREMSAREALLARRLNDIIDELQKQADVYNERAKELLKVEDGQVSQYTWAVSLRETYRRTIKTLEELLCEAERL